MTNYSVVVLTGGLGNQMFGLALALNLELEFKLPVKLDSQLGNPRKNLTNSPEVVSMAPYTQKLLFSEKVTQFQQRSFNFLLRQTGHIIESPNRVSNIVENFAKKSVSNRYTNRPIVFQDLTDSLSQVSCGNNYLFLGYFQNCESIGQSKLVFDTMMEITRPTEEFYSYWKKIGSEARPLVIHIRRGDYEKESFGLLSKDYYQIQVSKALSDAKAKEIWIFTDDEVHSKHIISDISGLPKRVFRRQDFTAAETMQIMRFGHGYVIANSSFSYWAAMLRHNLDAKVFAPMPWFQKGVSPLNILPLNWISSMPIWESPDSVMD